MNPHVKNSASRRNTAEQPFSPPRNVELEAMIPFRETRLDDAFAAFLQSKTVAIVGRSGIDTLQQGDKIDSYDVVARVHWPIPYHAGVKPEDRSEERTEMKWDPPPFVPKKWQSIVGSRTDIFYTSIAGGGEQWCQDIINTFLSESGRFICNESPHSQRARAQGTLRSYNPVRNVATELYCFLYEILDSQPLEGTIAIADILRHNIDSVYLTGFPCFISNEAPRGRREGGRKSYHDFVFLRELRNNHPTRIEVDPHMAELFEKY